ncbi:DNA mismatch repair protein Mlh1 [Neocloeon triangulifer]|uniref:DNA mismatch repair protein Mlh1 n=1 Tax=Neocloeon triangulifer TaxID=2078957 RepID=UPI00286F11F4|nr:DNA mismatch repair protein Mlh1 [Neocloeon triangulifer]
MNEGGIIKKLDDIVINRIAAGEVIQRPSNALKEMLENSLDAKATSIQIVVKDGGIKSLQILDNGTGIRLKDMDIVCERFTTSKLRKFEDLATVGTYGFRGEALASISHVAHVTITTMTANAKCAFKATYVDGKIQGQPKPCAANQGTKILVEDLFYNVKTRRDALKPSEEFSRICDLVSKYSIQNAQTAFSLKKQGETTAAVSTPVSSSAKSNIQLIYGSDIAKELFEINAEDNDLKLKLTGHATSGRYKGGRLELIIFINGRLVECPSIKKLVELVYMEHLPSKSYPFVYLSLEMPQRFVDVNVHPTKESVEFLNERAIIERVGQELKEKLNANHKSKSQGVLVEPSKPVQALVIDQEQAKKPTSKNSSGPKRSSCDLDSIKELRKEIDELCSPDLQDIFSTHTYVGGDWQKAVVFIQHQTKLCMFQVQEVCSEFFYQLLINQFAKIGQLRFKTPLDLQSAALEALNLEECGWEESHGPKEELASAISAFLTQKRAMLEEYFGIVIDAEGKMLAFPLLLDNYVPNFGELPMLIVRLATDVEWDEERQCFQSVCREIASLYAHPELGLETVSVKEQDEHGTIEFNTVMESVVMRAMRTEFMPPKSILEKHHLLQVARTEDLYRIFERC